MKTETKKATNYKTFYENIILDNIDLEPYDLSNDMYLYDKVITLFNIFKKEYVHEFNLKQYKGNLTIIFAEWLRGLPTVLTVPFYNYEILEAAKNAGFKLDTEQKEDDFLNTYFDDLAKAFFTLKDNL